MNFHEESVNEMNKACLSDPPHSQKKLLSELFITGFPLRCRHWAHYDN